MSAPSPNLSGAVWRKSSYSNGDGGDCVEIAGGYSTVVPVRDSKNPDGPALLFTPTAWTAFLGALRADEFASPR